VMEVLRTHVETVEVVGLDEAYLDLEGLLSPRAAMRRVITAIRSETGLNASVGIGPNKLVAKVASDAEKPRGFVALTREEACARFAAAPPGLVPGIGPKTAARLLSMGIATLGALAGTPEAVLCKRFGANLGRDLRRRARFEGSAVIDPVRTAVSESREETFPADIDEDERQAAELARLADELCARLVRQQRRGRTVAIKVRLDDFTTITRARTLSAATNDAVAVRRVALELLRAYAPPRPVRLLGVRVAGFEHGPPLQPGQLALPL